MLASGGGGPGGGHGSGSEGDAKDKSDLFASSASTSATGGIAAADQAMAAHPDEDKAALAARVNAIMQNVSEEDTCLGAALTVMQAEGGDALDDLRLLTWLVCGGMDPDKKLEEFKVKDGANCCKCTTTWAGDHVAYRCKTCGVWGSSCMCVDCFDIDEHQGHDFRMYSSSTGGCCDCGDPAAWRPDGFCKKHKAAAAAAGDPIELLGPQA